MSEPVSMLDAALAYAERGLPVFPVNGKAPLTEHGFRDATVDPGMISRWWQEFPNAGIGNPPSEGEVVIDVDPRNSGDKSLSELTVRLGMLPPTVTTKTGGGGVHLRFRIPLGLRPPKQLAPGVELKGGGTGYVILPPSMHPSGNRYVWEPYCDPEEQAIAQLPEAWLDEIRRIDGRERGPAPPLPDVIPEGQRDCILTSLAGSMRRRGASEIAILAALQVENQSRCKPPLPEDDLRRIAGSIARKPPAGAPPSEAAGGAGSVERKSEIVAAKPRTPRMVRAVDVAEERIEWLWGSRIPKRYLTFISGDPGIGKSHIAVDLAARLSKGEEWPDSGRPAPGATLFLSSEDGIADVLRPRLRVAGADLQRIGFLVGKFKPDHPTVEFLLTLKDDLAAIEAELPQWTDELDLPIRLLVVDPLLNHLGRIDPNREGEARPLLAEVGAFLRRTRLAMIGIRHLNKAQEKALLYRAGGSIAFTGAARAEYLVGTDPEDPTSRVFARIKGNLSLEPDALAYRIVGAPGEPEISTIEWLGPTEKRAEDVIASSRETRGPQTDRAIKMLNDLLEEGQEMTAEEVFLKAKELQIGQNTVRAAAKKIGVNKRPAGFRGEWVWSLTEDVS